MAGEPRTVRVVVVDDQETFRSAARMVIDLTAGFEMAGEASSGEEAVRLVDELAPDLVLMDIKMGGIGGLEAIRRVATRHPDVRVMALSTYEEYAHQALDAGAATFISKADFDSRRLVAAWAEAR